MTIWFTSDTHFGHTMVAGLRGFETVREHDDTVIRNWNKLVKPDDLVWHLGDVGLGSDHHTLFCVSRLKGRKQLITGNHDAVWPAHRDARKHQRAWMEVFESVQAYGRIKLSGNYYMLSHFPYDGDHTAEVRHQEYRLKPSLDLIHGHTHSDGRWARHGLHGPEMFHVGLDAWGLKPVEDQTLIELRKRPCDWDMSKFARYNPNG